MRASRGMGAIDPSKMPKAKKMARRDDTDFTQYAEGGEVKPAAKIDGNEFVLAAQKYGLDDSDKNLLNKIVNLVNQGKSVDQAAKQVRDKGAKDTLKVEKPNQRSMKLATTPSLTCVNGFSTALRLRQL
jgi:hypothetical protein